MDRSRARREHEFVIGLGRDLAGLQIERDQALAEQAGAGPHGARWGGRRPGTYGDAGVYSLYATKTISTGEGGMLVTDDDALVHELRYLRQRREALGGALPLRNPRAPQLPVPPLSDKRVVMTVPSVRLMVITSAGSRSRCCG